MLPELIVNRHFMTAFIEAESPCVALGMVEVEASLSALIALRFNQPIPKSVMAGGFAFGHSMLGGSTWEIVHLAFQFYGFATYNALLNPSNPATRFVLTAMVQTGGYFVFALDSDRSTTAFRSDLGRDTLAGLRDNMARIQASTTTDAQYRSAVRQFAANPHPPGLLLNWVCQDQDNALDRAEDRLALRPA